MELVLTKATGADVEETYAIMEEIRRLGIGDWDEEYPTLDIVEEDAREGQLYILREAGRIIASVTIRAQKGDYDGDLFDDCGAKWAAAENPAILSRLCVAADMQGKGLGGGMAIAAAKKALELGFDSARLIAAVANPVAVELYRRHHFDERGGTHLFDEDFVCFDATKATVLV